MATEEPEPAAQWWYDHIGRIAGVVLSVLFVGFVAFLAVIGWTPARVLLILVFAGVVMISLGGRLHAR